MMEEFIKKNPNKCIDKQHPDPQSLMHSDLLYFFEFETSEKSEK